MLSRTPPSFALFFLALTLAYPSKPQHRSDQPLEVGHYKRITPSSSYDLLGTASNVTSTLSSAPKATASCFPPTLDHHGLPRHPPILFLPDCGQAARQLLSSPYEPAGEPRTWSPIRREWRAGGCGISLMPDHALSAGFFSRGAIAAAALEVKSACVNTAHGWRGGEMLMGGNRAFEVGIFGLSGWGTKE